jgi:hypothetical protein
MKYRIVQRGELFFPQFKVLFWWTDFYLRYYLYSLKEAQFFIERKVEEIEEREFRKNNVKIYNYPEDSK